MFQLEFFPRLEFKSLSDFQRLESSDLSLTSRKLLSQTVEFYASPRPNDVIRCQHANLIDKILGFRAKYIEEMLVAQAQGFDPDVTHQSWAPSLHGGVQTWVGLDLQTLQTPYAECLRILQLLKIRPYQHVIDLGAAYGRMGIVIGGLYIKNSFLGYEYVKARVDEGNRVYKELGFTRCQLKEQDLFDSDFQLPEADIFFTYDYGQVEHIDHTLKQIECIAHKRPVKIVVRGKFTKKIIADRYTSFNLLYEGKLEDFFSIYSVYLP
jgi:hypothetical protein